MQRFSIRLIVVTLAAGLAAPALAQDSQYWTNHYGTRAELLGGTVVGGVSDLSSTFYNPGALSRSRDNKLVLSTNAIQVTRIVQASGAGLGRDLSSTQAGSAPSMFAARITGDWLGKYDMAVSFLTRYNFKVSATQRAVQDGRIFDPGSFTGEAQAFTDLSEEWYGVTLARPFWKTGGIGISQYVIYRSQKARTQTVAQAVSSVDDRGASGTLIDEYYYRHFRTLWKLGVAFEARPFSIGLTLTTPGLGITGQAQRFIDNSYVSTDSVYRAPPGSDMASTWQNDISPTFHSPFSAALGATYHWQNTALTMTIEWFDKIPSYTAIDAEPLTPQTGGAEIDTDVVQELNAVFNWGIGIEQVFSEKTKFYAAVFADRTGYVSRSASMLSASSWDIWHLSLGSVFTVLKVDFTLGLSYGRGRGETDRFVNFRDPAQGVVPPPDDETSVSYDRLKAVFGISFPYDKDS